MIPTLEQLETLAEAIERRQPLPPMSCQDISEGYQLQAALSDFINGGRQVGLKASVTSAPVQQHLGLDAPLIASIYQRGKLQTGCVFSVEIQQQLEFEIGAIVDSEGNPIALLPIVEIVYLVFSNPDDYGIPNAVAANLGADRYICGATVPWDEHLETIDIKIEKDDIFVSTQRNQYSFGAPNAGVHWMVEEAHKRGLWHSNNQNKIMLLGTCGEPITAEPGNYKINFGELGEISFSITPN